MRCRSASTSRRSPRRIDIVGAPELRVRVSSDRPQANIAVRLCDVHPDGASEPISYGVLNLTHRNSHEFPKRWCRARPFTARVVLDQCAYRVPAGHRLRVAVSNAYWPMIWPSPEPVRLDLVGGDADAAAAPAGARRRSRVPDARRRHALGDRDGSARQFRASSSSATRRPASSRCRIIDDFGEVRDLDSRPCQRQHRPRDLDDPSRRSAVGLAAKRTGRRRCREMNGRCAPKPSPRCARDAQSFIVSARIEAYEGEILVFERDFEEKVPRALL